MIGERVLVTCEQFVVAGFRLVTPGLCLLDPRRQSAVFAPTEWLVVATGWRV
jgi:hypothetical protein